LAESSTTSNMLLALLTGWCAPSASYALGATRLTAPVLQPAARMSVPAMGLSFPSFSGSSGPSYSGPSEEVQALYRMLGVSEDADYDEITLSYEALCEKYKGETKRLIKLQVARDKILEERLRQRMSGALKGKVADSPFDRPEPKKELKLPPWLDEIAELPTKAYLTKNVIVFGLMGLLPAISRTFAATSIGMALATSYYLLYNRGADTPNDEYGAAARPPKARPLLLTLGICLLTLCLGACASTLLVPFFPFLPQELLISLSASAGLCFACSFFRVQDD